PGGVQLQDGDVAGAVVPDHGRVVVEAGRRCRDVDRPGPGDDVVVGQDHAVPGQHDAGARAPRPQPGDVVGDVGPDGDGGGGGRRGHLLHGGVRRQGGGGPAEGESRLRRRRRAAVGAGPGGGLRRGGGGRPVGVAEGVPL